MSYVVDSNILLRIIQYNHPMRAEALRAAVNLLRQDDFNRFPTITVVTPPEIN